MAKDLIEIVKEVAIWAKGAPVQAGILTVLLTFILSYLLNGTARSIPGPFWAKFTDFWLLKQAVNGNRFEVVHDLHKKHGKFVRLAPNHISIADHKALNAVYGHSTGTQKSLYYDAFVPPKPFPRGLFNTRDRQEHSRKRKIVSHTFAPKSITAFEPFIRRETQLLLDFCDEKCRQAQEKKSEGPRGLKGYALVDALEILNFWAFDTIGVLAFGKPFGMLESGKDEARVEYEGPSGKKVDYVPAIKTINERGEYSASMGLAPVWIRPYLAKLPWFAQRLRSVKALTGIALARVNDRLVNGSDRDDLLSKLQNAKDDSGENMGKMELTAEALTQLIAGSDTTSNTSTAILYHVVSHPKVYEKLRKEIDEHLKETEEVPLNSDVESLPYLQAVINESLRFHSTSSLGLPRIIPTGGSTICGKFFPSGTVVSCPAYTIHREKEVWGDDAEEYNPDRWLENDKKELEKAFIPFSVGPRACVGRNVALMELNIVVGALFKRYDFELEKGTETKMDTIEGFLRKPTTLPTLMKRRS